MIVILGLIILIAAVVVAVVGVLTNGGSAHQLTDGFSVFGYHVTGSTGTLFLYGIAVGVLAVFGLSLLVAAARHRARHSRTARRDLRHSGYESAAERGDAIGPTETDRVEGAHARESDHDDRSGAAGGARSRWHPFRHRSATH
ncbi:hypothetical protein [Streptomyces sp. NBC_01727]|uniref:hypothetical protein n=1 Tax=unclassified Streptomyces TaxID=2593676 RepID=UPI002E1158C6|nr:hypothetical protein OIE76_03325 [Streptomyces sp. NBC_01727]